MLQPLSAVPVMKPLEQQRLELKGVVRGRVGDTHHIGKDTEHEQVIFVAARPGHGAPMWGDVELFEQRLHALEPALGLRHAGMTAEADQARVFASAARFSRMNAEPASSMVKIAKKTITTSIQSSG